MLENETIFREIKANGVKMHGKVGDVALAVLLHMSGQNLQDYGLGRVLPDKRSLFYSDSIFFDTADAREQALEKWRRWAAENLTPATNENEQ